MTAIETNALVKLLEECNPEALKKLAVEYPTHANHLDPTEKKGGVNPDVIDSKMTLEVKLKLSLEGLQAARREVPHNRTRIQKRLYRAGIVRLVGSIISLLSSAGVVAAMFHDDKSSKVAVIMAVIAFCASFCALIAGYYESSPYGGKKNLADVLDSLNNVDVQSTTLERDLKIFLETTLKSTGEEYKNILNEVSTVIKNANNIAEDLLRLQFGLWGAPTSAPAA